MAELVLSLFPGVGLLDHAFEVEGFCVVRGPDLLWGGDVRRFHPPPDRFDGVIGGPPCQRWSRLSALVRHVHGADRVAECLIPEYERVVHEAQPAWFLMENVPAAPEPAVPGYQVSSMVLDNQWVDRGDGIGQEQRRRRRWSFGTCDGRELDLTSDLAVLRPDPTPTVCASGTIWSRKNRVPVGSKSRAHLRLAQIAQGLPDRWSIAPPFTVAAAFKAVGNGVPIAMGRALARAVRRERARCAPL